MKTTDAGLSEAIRRLRPAAQPAMALTTEELARLGWEPEELQRRRKGDKQKVKLPRKHSGLRRETTMSLKWIAEELRMGSWTYVSNLLTPLRLKGKCKK